MRNRRRLARVVGASRRRRRRHDRRHCERLFCFVVFVGDDDSHDTIDVCNWRQQTKSAPRRRRDRNQRDGCINGDGRRSRLHDAARLARHLNAHRSLDDNVGNRRVYNRAAGRLVAIVVVVKRIVAGRILDGAAAATSSHARQQRRWWQRRLVERRAADHGRRRVSRQS